MPHETKDPAALYQADPANFAIAWKRLLDEAQPWHEYADAARVEVRAQAKEKAVRLLAHDNVLMEVRLQCRELGVICEVILAAPAGFTRTSTRRTCR